MAVVFGIPGGFYLLEKNTLVTAIYITELEHENFCYLCKINRTQQPEE